MRVASWRVGRAAEGARLEIVLTLTALRGFKSHALRQISHRDFERSAVAFSMPLKSPGLGLSSALAKRGH